MSSKYLFNTETKEVASMKHWDELIQKNACNSLSLNVVVPADGSIAPEGLSLEECSKIVWVASGQGIFMGSTNFTLHF